MASRQATGPLSGLWLAAGTLTALPAPAVRRATPATARAAMVLAPVAVLPLAAAVALVVLACAALGIAPLVTGFLGIGVLALGSRALHLDGLSDTADALTASYDPERSLAVMKGGTAGPAGAATLVVVLGVQASALGAVVTQSAEPWQAALVAGAAVCASRAALWVTASTRVPPARADGLGVTFTRTVPAGVTLGGWLAIAAAAGLVDRVGGPVTVAVSLAAVVALTARAVRRFGGVTGDVFGAAIEVALAALLAGWSTAL